MPGDVVKVNGNCPFMELRGRKAIVLHVEELTEQAHEQESQERVSRFPNAESTTLVTLRHEAAPLSQEGMVGEEDKNPPMEGLDSVTQGNRPASKIETLQQRPQFS